MATTLAETFALPSKLLSKDANGKIVEVDTETALAGKFVAMYFSAHWCPPCRGFTPVLKQFYQSCLDKGKPFTVVYVSQDSSPAEFQEYYGTMPWLAVPYEKAGARTGLSRRHKVLGIPQLTILNKEGQVLNSNARSALSRDPEGARFPWVGEEDKGVGGGLFQYIALAVLLLLYYFFVMRK